MAFGLVIWCRDFAMIFAIFTKVCGVFCYFLLWFSTVLNHDMAYYSHCLCRQKFVKWILDKFRIYPVWPMTMCENYSDPGFNFNCLVVRLVLMLKQNDGIVVGKWSMSWVWLFRLVELCHISIRCADCGCISPQIQIRRIFCGRGRMRILFCDKICRCRLTQILFCNECIFSNKS